MGKARSIGVTKRRQFSQNEKAMPVDIAASAGIAATRVMKTQASASIKDLTIVMKKTMT